MMVSFVVFTEALINFNEGSAIYREEIYFFLDFSFNLYFTCNHWVWPVLGGKEFPFLICHSCMWELGISYLSLSGLWHQEEQSSQSSQSSLSFWQVDFRISSNTVFETRLIQGAYFQTFPFPYLFSCKPESTIFLQTARIYQETSGLWPSVIFSLHAQKCMGCSLVCSSPRFGLSFVNFCPSAWAASVCLMH